MTTYEWQMDDLDDGDALADEPGSPENEAALRLADLVSPDAIDRMLADADMAVSRSTGQAGC